MTQDLEALNNEIDVITRKKVGIIAKECFETLDGIRENYKIGLITFQEFLCQSRDISETYQVVLKEQLNHKTKVL